MNQTSTWSRSVSTFQSWTRGACVEVDPSSIVWFHIQNLDFAMQADIVHELDELG
jgi:hypothetical protein